RRSFIVGALGVTAATAILSGCGGASAPSSSGPGAAASSATSAPPASVASGTAPSAAGATPKIGGTLTVAVPVEPQNLDSNYLSTPGTEKLNINLFSRLVRPNVKTGEVQADAATDWKNVDPTTWQFKLRDGIKFHNGETLDAASVKSTF